MDNREESIRILIIDDDDDDIFLISDTLGEIEERDIEIHVERSPTKGIEALAHNAYDVALCDFKLGAMSGIDVIKFARSEKIETPIILLTGVGNKTVDQAALEAGAADFLAKDTICAASLDRAIRYAVANHSRQQLLHAIVNNANAAVLVMDKEHRPILWNTSLLQLAEQYARRTGSDAIDLLLTEIVAHESGDLRIGQVICDIHVADLSDGGRICALHDVTERVKALEERRDAERRIAHLAVHDSLTGLPNRTAFNVRLADEIKHALGSRGEFYLLNLDLDRFKEVNDVFGHGFGDSFLIEVTNRLNSVLAGNEFLARLGGDEFVAIQRKIGSEGGMPSLAERFAEAVTAPFTIEGKVINATVSIGAAEFPQHGRDTEALLSNADAAMYRAKSSIGTSISLFDRDMDESIRKRRALANDLKTALATNQIDVYFQPQALVLNRKIVGFEALARWQHPNYGYVCPEEFIPIAEENGLIIELGDTVLKKACSFAAQMPDLYKISVNISPVQIKQSDLYASIESALNGSGLDAQRLELEITESLFIDDLDRTTRVLEALRKLGISIVMDDFGTGYSSLRSLISFPFDSIKIDKSFVSEIGRCNQAEEIMRAVAQLAANLNFDVVAEGVEKEQHVRFLSACGCKLMQGYLIGAPTGRRQTNKTIIEPDLTDRLRARREEAERLTQPADPQGLRKSSGPTRAA
ncbi:MAG: EAL domain-containing response regulator [Hyphomicrobiaceae bacterium]